MQTICAAALAATGIDICQSDVFDLKINNDIEAKFSQHIAKYGYSYGTKEEFLFRLEQFAITEAKINKMNSQNKSWRSGHNKFSTWTDEEFNQILGEQGEPEEIDSSRLKEFNVQGLPTSKDWRPLGAVNAIKDQGHCGSCWSFSATSAIESAHFIAAGKLLSLSEQQLVDCDP